MFTHADLRKICAVRLKLSKCRQNVSSLEEQVKIWRHKFRRMLISVIFLSLRKFYPSKIFGEIKNLYYVHRIESENIILALHKFIAKKAQILLILLESESMEWNIIGSDAWGFIWNQLENSRWVKKFNFI